MQERPTLTLSDALVALDAIRTQLETGNRSAAIAVCDDHGELVAFARTDGCRLPSIGIAQNKAYTAAREQTDSKALGELAQRGQFPVSYFGGLRYTGWAGGVPIRSGETVVGAVGVSGLTEDEDVEFARLGVHALEVARGGTA
jgi:glc operon protein GlcG